jgi:hypothetical protein
MEKVRRFAIGILAHMLAFCVASIGLICAMFSTNCYADVTYTPLLTSTSFDGPKADLLLACNGMLLFIVIVLGLGLIARVLMK